MGDGGVFPGEGEIGKKSDFGAGAYAPSGRRSLAWGTHFLLCDRWIAGSEFFVYRVRRNNFPGQQLSGTCVYLSFICSNVTIKCINLYL